MLCFKYLPPGSLWSLCQTYPRTFSSQNNQFWTDRFIEMSDGLSDKVRVNAYGLFCVKMSASICFNCRNYTEGRLDQIPFCHNCREKPAHITKTRAKSAYCLNDTDLDKLKCELKRNPHYRSAAPMTLYLFSDVEKLANCKHPNLRMTLDQKIEKSRRRADKKNKPRIKRRQLLSDALKEKGLQIRSDSKLCDGFIDGTLGSKWTLKNVVEMCCEMKWLFEHTSYKEELDQEVQELGREYKRDGWVSWGQAFREAFDDAEPGIRRSILKRSEVFPWVNGNR